MIVIALACSLFVAAFGALGLVSPSWVLRFQAYLQTPAGLYFAAGVRLVMGAALFLAAPESRAPGVLRILGVVIVLTGVITAFLGLERFRRLIDWWSAKGPSFVRAWAAIALALGLSLMYALVP